jgi:hypothetical protein
MALILAVLKALKYIVLGAVSSWKENTIREATDTTSRLGQTGEEIHYTVISKTPESGREAKELRLENALVYLVRVDGPRGHISISGSDLAINIEVEDSLVTLILSPIL